MVAWMRLHHMQQALGGQGIPRYSAALDPDGRAARDIIEARNDAQPVLETHSTRPTNRLSNRLDGMLDDWQEIAREAQQDSENPALPWKNPPTAQQRTAKGRSWRRPERQTSRVGKGVFLDARGTEFLRTVDETVPIKQDDGRRRTRRITTICGPTKRFQSRSGRELKRSTARRWSATRRSLARGPIARNHNFPRPSIEPRLRPNSPEVDCLNFKPIARQRAVHR